MTSGQEEMTMAVQTSQFLQNPLEIRLEIYSYVHTESLKQYPPGSRWNGVSRYRAWRNLSLTCRQIRQEFLPFMVNVEYCKFSMSDIIFWAEAGYPHLLELIRTLYFRFDASDLPLDAVRILEPGAPGTPSSSWGNRGAHYRQQQLAAQDFEVEGIVSRLRSAMASLHHVKHLTLDGKMDTICPKQAHALLEMFSTALPNLSTLNIEMSKYPISILRHHHNLKYLEFTGRAVSTPDETLSVFKSLKYLGSISLVDPPTTIDNATARNPPVCLTPDVLAHMNSLRHFSIITSTKLSKADSWPFLTKPMVKSLHAHISDLRHLSITLLRVETSKAMLNELLGFISSSQLEYLVLELKVSKRLRNSNFRSFLPRVSYNRVVTVAIIKVRPNYHQQNFHRLSMIWETVPKPYGHVPQLGDELNTTDRARGVVESEDDSDAEEVHEEESVEEPDEDLEEGAEEESEEDIVFEGWRSELMGVI
jgi:hypothetical protein